MNDEITVSKRVIDYCVNPFDVDKLNELGVNECRQILPFLTRLWKRSQDDSVLNEEFKLAVFQKLRQFEDTNRICSYLNADFAQIYEDVIRQLSIRKKTQTLSVYSYGDFEPASPTAKLLMISNMLLNGNIRLEENSVCKYSSIDYSLLDFEIYFQDLSDILCIIHAELGEVISLSQFIYTLLHIQSPLCANYIINIVANSVDSLFQVVDILLEGCNCSMIDIQRHKCLIAIASRWPTLKSYIIYESIRRHCLPSVILTLANEDYLVNILLSILQFEHDRTWFVHFLRSQNKNFFEKQAVDHIREDLVALSARCRSTPYLDIKLFKIYSALRIFAGLKFNDAEVNALIDMILNTNEISLGVSFLLIYPPLYDLEVNLQRMLQWLRDKFQHAQQTILLVAIYSSTYQIQLLNEFVTNTIGFKFSIKQASLNSIRLLFQRLFPDDTLLNEYTRSLPIMAKLNANTSHTQTKSSSTPSSLGIYFLNQWIKTSSFMNKKQTELNNWLFKQILECVEPLHPMMLTLLNNYVNQLFNLNNLTDNRPSPLSPHLIMDFFKQNYTDYDSSITPKLLLFYYLLAYESKRRETIIYIISEMPKANASQNTNLMAISSALNFGSQQGNVSSNPMMNKQIISCLDTMLNFKYPNEIFNLIPVNYFLLKAKKQDFLVMYPGLLKYVINMFTQLCQVEHSLYQPKLDSGMKREKWRDLDSILAATTRIKQRLNEGELTRSEAYVFKILWFKSYSVHGRKLSLKTAEIILDLNNLKYDDIYLNPLILLRSDKLEIYKCGPLFEIVLYILRECLSASKNQYEFAAVETQLMGMLEAKANQANFAKALKEKQDLKHALIISQDTTVIQILLDLFLLIKKRSNELESREVQCIVCSFLHQMFIENTSLAEIVHFQGYPMQLIPVLVKGVPSMHICLEFLPKLLQHYDLDKQIFGINLAASLCDKYPIVKAFNMAKLAINVAFTLLQSQTVNERKQLISQIDSALVTFYKKFPPLTQECMSLITNAVQTKSIDVDNLTELAGFEL